MPSRLEAIETWVTLSPDARRDVKVFLRARVTEERRESSRLRAEGKDGTGSANTADAFLRAVEVLEALEQP